MWYPSPARNIVFSEATEGKKIGVVIRLPVYMIRIDRLDNSLKWLRFLWRVTRYVADNPDEKFCVTLGIGAERRLGEDQADEALTRSLEYLQ